jgi:hypothetical protein
MADFHYTRYKKNKINEILSILRNAKISVHEHDSTQEPFFNHGKNKDFDIDFDTISNVPEGLNHSVKLLFEIIGSPDKEVYIGHWTILSFNKCMENYKQYCNDSQESVFDIAIMYMGMGHVIVLSCDLDTHSLFYRRDGGSNGWDREANYKDLLKYDGTKNKQFLFNKLFHNTEKIIEFNTI